MDWKPFAPALAYGDYAELYAEESYGLAIRYEDGRVDEIESGESNGMALRYIQGEETRFGHVDGFVSEPVLRLARGLAGGLRKNAPPRLNGSPDLRRHSIS